MLESVTVSVPLIDSEIVTNKQKKEREREDFEADE
jgi:hypothetical protein